jgi:hypothetical protein
MSMPLPALFPVPFFPVPRLEKNVDLGANSLYIQYCYPLKSRDLVSLCALFCRIPHEIELRLTFDAPVRLSRSEWECGMDGFQGGNLYH